MIQQMFFSSFKKMLIAAFFICTFFHLDVKTVFHRFFPSYFFFQLFIYIFVLIIHFFNNLYYYLVNQTLKILLQ